MSERNLILGTLRRAPGVLFVEPGRHLVTQAEVHDRARAERARRGLPASHPYLGWHTQADGFDRSGALVRPQRVYFGGDRAAVARALSLLEPHGFAVLGGRADTEAFVLRRDAAPRRADPALADEWRTRLDVLGDDQSGPVPLRDGEEELLHALIAHPAVRDLHAPAARALRLRGALSPTDLDTVLSPDGLDALRPHGDEAAALVAHALETGHPRARPAATVLAELGRADGRVLNRWKDPAAVRAARAAALEGRQVSTFLDLAAADGADPVSAAVDLAEDIRAAGGEDAAPRVLAAATGLVSRFGGSTRDHALSALRDERVPPWLRAVIADRWTRSPVLAADPSTRPTPETRAAASAWPDTVDAVRAAVGLPPGPGFDPEHRPGRDAAIELREAVVARHLDGLRAALTRPGLSEPALAVLLELLHGANALRAQDLAPFARTWRKRLFVKPDPYTSAPPAVVTYAAALAAQGADTADRVADAVLRDARRWSLPVRLLLLGAVDRGRDADLAAEAELLPHAHGGAEGTQAAAHALALVRARLRGTTPVAAACASVLEAPERPPFVRRGFANVAVSVAEGGSGLWAHHFRRNSVRALEAALRVAGDEDLPAPARRAVLDLADESSALDRTGRSRPENAARLRAEREELRSRLRA
ncbi:hypothetical protein [Nocardiopsis sp. CC223A]|uniref:hypothetical protein n=1 Tax=Nocardiopsis sp. CC223A TaxID=3044051 RepID=UPI00278C0EB7|nr:hypothetical protein [Nocardiopsis sp. CC223A]